MNAALDSKQGITRTRSATTATQASVKGTRSRKGSVVAPAHRSSYSISSNGAAGDWYWQVTNRGEIIARGLATPEAVARADAIRAALSHVRPGSLGGRHCGPTPSGHSPVLR